MKVKCILNFCMGIGLLISYSALADVAHKPQEASFQKQLGKTSLVEQQEGTLLSGATFTVPKSFKRINVQNLSTLIKNIDDYLHKATHESHFSGVALVTYKDKIILKKGYGTANKHRQKNNGDTIMHVASITKQFTAAAIMQLVEAGKINLTSSINVFLPNKYRSEKWENVSIHHLLSHTSGIPDYAVQRDYYDVIKGFCFDQTVDGMVKEAMKKELEFKPGSQFSYTNLGYTILGIAIENQTGLSFDQYMSQNILQPLKMNASGIHVAGHKPKVNEAAGYRWDPGLKKFLPDDVVSLPVTSPDGGLFTTVSDFLTWVHVLQGKTSGIMTAESLKKMKTPSIETPMGGAGYGLFINKDVLHHPGSIVGFQSHFVMDLNENFLVAIFANNTESKPWSMTSDIAKIIKEDSLDGNVLQKRD